jgi:hypothetical protein|tara:strand:+ start:266 stop:478 length:213 start_codon:yes stop_codon:yes gene_type:complete
MDWDKRHGGPYDRGGADSWYQRGYDPHYYTGESITSLRYDIDSMTAEEITAYTAGYDANESDPGARKDWG